MWGSVVTKTGVVLLYIWYNFGMNTNTIEQG